jgi:hypothetical protein
MLHSPIRFLLVEFYARPTGVQGHVTLAVINHTNSGTGPFRLRRGWGFYFRPSQHFGCWIYSLENVVEYRRKRSDEV